MKFIVGKCYYTRSGKVAEITRSDAIVEGYVLNAGGDNFTLWGADGRRNSTRRSPIDLTEAVAPSAAPASSPSLAAPLAPVPVVHRIAEPRLQPQGMVADMEQTGPQPIRGFVAEFNTDWADRYFSPIFESKHRLASYIDRQARDFGRTLIRVTTVAEVPQELCA